MMTVWTIGHSTRTLQELAAALQSFGVAVLVDVRRFPASRRNPQFQTDRLRKGLFQAGIDYAYLGDELGGWRKARPDSRHVGLRNASFRGYADWMEGEPFRRGVEALLRVAQSRPACVMCAERPVSNCHRGLLGDYLALVRGVDVVDIYDAGDARSHRPTPGARVEERTVVYERSDAARLESFGES